MLQNRYGVHVGIERSYKLAALYEKWSSPAKVCGASLLIALRTGIGMAIINRGEIYSSSSGFDGEIGHTVIDINGPKCECGNRGCLETFVSSSAICERAKTMLKQGRCIQLKTVIDAQMPLRPEHIYRLAKAGDKDCAEIVADVGRYIGIAASNMINLLAPNEIIICGSIDTADEIILRAVRSEIEKSALKNLKADVNVRLAKANEKSSLFGAAVLAIQDMFELPKIELTKVAAFS
jgi:N-acetylglucosamine repressor